MYIKIFCFFPPTHSNRMVNVSEVLFSSMFSYGPFGASALKMKIYMTSCTHFKYFMKHPKHCFYEKINNQCLTALNSGSHQISFFNVV